jgi:hypothetical protein
MEIYIFWFEDFGDSISKHFYLVDETLRCCLAL